MLANGRFDLVVGVAAVAAVVAVGRLVNGRSARRPSTRRLRALAAERGWRFRAAMVAPIDTPFLRLGDEHEAGPIFEVEILGVDALLYEHRRVHVEGDGTRTTTASFVVLRLLLTMPGIDQVRLKPLAGGDARGVAALNARRLVSLESVELEQRFALEVGDGTDELALRELFTPALISSLLDLADGDGYLGEYLDYGGGILVLAGSGTIDAGDGPALDATVRDATPVIRVLLEHAAVPSR